MKFREFNAILTTCSTKKRPGQHKRLVPEKVRALPKAQRLSMAQYIVRQRGPVLLDLVYDIDWKWMVPCGYLYQTTGKKGYTFIHTCEHTIQ